MGLAGRKQIVLAAVVEHYLRTGEPVGSKAVLEHGSLNVSSATIRNDMAALEREGYLEQPHTSAGRIPTVAGCRYYSEIARDAALLCSLPGNGRRSTAGWTRGTAPTLRRWCKRCGRLERDHPACGGQRQQPAPVHGDQPG